MTEIGGYVPQKEQIPIPDLQNITVTENRAKTIYESLYAKATSLSGTKFDETNCIIIGYGQLADIDEKLQQNGLYPGLDPEYRYKVMIDDPSSGGLGKNSKDITETWAVVPMYGEEGIESLPLPVRWYIAQGIIEDIQNTRTIIQGNTTLLA